MSTCPLGCAADWQKREFTATCCACMLQYGMTFDIAYIEEKTPSLHVHWEKKKAAAADAQQKLLSTEAKLHATQAQLEAVQAQLKAVKASAHFTIFDG
jgi:hypothetical protein